MSELTPDAAGWVGMLLTVGCLPADGDPHRFTHPDDDGLAAAFDAGTGQLRVSPRAKERLLRAIRGIDCSGEEEPHWRDSANATLGHLAEMVACLPDLE